MRRTAPSILLIWALLATLFVVPAGAASGDDADPDPMTAARRDARPVDRNASGADQQRLDARLAAVADAPVGSVAGRVEVQVLLDDVPGAEFSSAVEALGGTVLDTRNTSALVDVPADQLRRLSSLEGVVFAREPIRPISLAVQSEGVAESGAGVWHGVGDDGAGTKVAVIDLSFSGWTTAQAQGDLPSGAETMNLCPSFEGIDAHGTAVAEIVHDMAPGADLALVCVDSIFDVETATDWAIANGVDIIVHSVAWLNSARGDGTQPSPSPDAAAQRAKDNGILWVNAAGNFAEDHYGAPFAPFDFFGTIVHDWDGAGDPDMNIFVPAGRSIAVYMKWDGWPTTIEDYDMVLYDIGSTVIAASFGDQTGGAEPVEFLSWVNTTGTDQTVFLELQQFSATQNLEMDIFVLGHGGIQANTVARSVVEPASSPAAVAVGAVCWSDDQLESFSAQGPTIDGRIKPDITAADGVSTFGFGSTTGGDCLSSFPGTSASAPHVGGAAALVLGKRPTYTPDQIMDILYGAALDRGPAGMDNQFGHGDLRLGDPLSAFIDIDNSPFINDIIWLDDQGITSGCSQVPALFCPGDPVTRGQMAAFIVRALGLPNTTTDYFVDDEMSPFENDINRLAEAGITNGCKLGPTFYCPADTVTRAQMASFLVDAFGVPPSAVDAFIDDDSSVHEGNINALAADGITSGCALPMSYCPSLDVTRGQMAAFLRRAITP